MDSGLVSKVDADLSLPASAAPTRSLTPVAQSYPSHTVAPAALQPASTAPPASATGTGSGEDPFGTQPPLARSGAAQAHRQHVRGDRRTDRQVLRRDQGPAPAAAEGQAAHDHRYGARLGRRLQPVLRLGVRRRVRAAAVRARDGPRVPAAPRGRSARARPCSSRSWAPRSSPSRSATTPSPRRASGWPARSSARSARRCAW